jgi:hypothetical protein
MTQLQIFIPFKRRNFAGDTVLVIMDGHGSHLTYESAVLAKAALLIIMQFLCI